MGSPKGVNPFLQATEPRNIGTDAMKRPRASIFSLMAVVGIVALNLAFARTVFPGEPWRLAGIGMIGSLIQVGLFFLIRARGKRRHYAFWAGFEAGSLLGVWSFLYARVPGSWVGYPWDVYAEFIDGWLLRAFNISVLNRGTLDPVLLGTVTVFAFLPQLLMGLAGGLLGLSFAWSARSRRVTLALCAGAAIMVLNLAAWLAAWAALPAQPPWLPYGITPGGLLLELGLYGLIRGWGLSSHPRILGGVFRPLIRSCSGLTSTPWFSPTSRPLDISPIGPAVRRTPGRSREHRCGTCGSITRRLPAMS